MSSKVYQFLGSIVTEEQLNEVLKKYIPVDDNSDIVSWLEATNEGLKVYMKDDQIYDLPLSQAKEFQIVEYDPSTKLLHFYDENRVDVYDPVLIDGSGSGTDAGIIMRLTNQNGTNSLVGSYGSTMTLMFTFTSTEDDLPTGNGTCVITVNNVPKLTMNIPQGLSAIDVSPYLSIGTNTVKVTCTDIYGNSRSLSYSITAIQLSVSSTFDATVPYDSDITFKYTPYGAVEKTIHFVIDGDEISTVVTSLSGKQLTKIIPTMSHGSHRIEIYSTAVVNDTELTSEKLVYDVIFLEYDETTPIIASIYTTESVTQGSQVSIPYIVYDPTKLACDITLTVYTIESGTEVVYSTQDITVDRSQWMWNTRKYPIGTVYFRIKYKDIHKTHMVTVQESSIKIEPETNDIELQLTSEGRSNNEINPSKWTYGDVSTTFSNMNWKSVGWIDDENGDTCLRLNGDSRAEINFKPFDEDLRTYGKTIELEFAIRDVHSRDAIPISCMSGGIGFEVKPDTTYLRSEQSEVFCNYKEEERVKVSFVIESRNESRLLSIYLNGVRSDAVQYPSTDNFQQNDPVNISIGSSDCGIDIYTIRSYTTALTSESVTNNFIADITDIVRKTETFEDNDIYDDYGNISFVKAKEKNSVMVIVGELPKSKGDKKTVTIYYYDVEDSTLNFIEVDVVIDVQGTSSQFYVRKNWKIKLSEEHHIDFDQLPAKVICIKVDYAEATGTHNTQNAVFVEKLYSEQTPAQKTNPKCRTTIYGKPILLFHQEDINSDPVFYGKANFNYDKGAEYVFGFTEDFDVECWEFCNNTSDACNFLGRIPDAWGDDFEARYPEDYTEISRFKAMHDWVVSTRRDTATEEELEEPYEDSDGNIYTHDTSEYRLAKFKMEFEDHFDMHYSLIYYVYTFFALMVDQRAKNMFLTYWGETGKWQPWFYDNDTCFGINNEGQLVFDYYHEDTDQLEGANVYNGQNSTLWCNFRDAFPDKIKETYQNLRSNSILNRDELEEQFITKGSDKWSESIYNEDADFKYISMLKSDNDATNLPQVRGTGEEHLRYYFENRLNYCDSKWYATDYADDYISLRIYTPVDENGDPRTDLVVPANADITVTPYSHMYAGVRYKANGTLYQKRVSADETVTFEAPNEVFNDTETAIYGASQLSSLGDLSPLYCGSINVVKGTKLTVLLVGSGKEGYSNPNLNHLSVGPLLLLKILDVRNCPNLTEALGLAGCLNIEEIYAGGSGITGIELPDSGYVRIIELPATIKNLTLSNQLYIESLTLEGYDKIKTIQIENCPTVRSLDILNNSPNVERVRLTNVEWSYDDATELLALAIRDIGGIDENGTNTETMWIDGTCHIGTLTGTEYNTIKAAFPYLTITYDTLSSVLTFMSETGTEVLGTQTIQNGGNGEYTGNVITKESTAQYDFSHNGWSLKAGGEADVNALLNVEGDRTVYAAFSKTVRNYTVNFYVEGVLKETYETPYGGTATYAGETPVSQYDYLEFTGWSPSPVGITGNTDCHAQWYDTREISDDWETIVANCLNGTATDKYAIGSYKPVEITYEDGTSETIDFEVIGHNHDELADGINKWESVSNLTSNAQVTNGGIIEFNNEIHSFGYAGHYKWDGSAWVVVSTLPHGLHYSTIVVYNSAIHILGHSNASSEYYKKHYKFDGNEWTEVGELPYGGASKAVVWNDMLYVYFSSSSGFYKYDGTEWTALESITGVSSTIYLNMTAYEDVIHVVNGNTSGSIKHYIYDGTSWTTLAEKLEHNGRLISNMGNLYMFTETEIYVWDGAAWIYCSNIPIKAYYNLNQNRINVIKNEIHAVCDKKHYKWSTIHVENIGKSPVINYNYCFEHENNLYTCGTNAIYMYDGESWSEVCTLPDSLTASSACYYNGELYVYTDNDSSHEYYRCVLKYDWNEWTVFAPDIYTATGIRACRIIWFNDTLYVFGENGSAIKQWCAIWTGTEWEVKTGSEFYGGSRFINVSGICVYNGYIHIVENGKFWRYDHESGSMIIIAGGIYGTEYTHGNSLTVHNGYLYITNGTHTHFIRYDGEKLVYMNNKIQRGRFGSLCTFRGRLYSVCGELGEHVLISNPKATLTFACRQIPTIQYIPNTAKTDENGNTGTTVGGWELMDIRKNLNEEFLINNIPEELQQHIVSVIKFSDGGYYNQVIKHTEDKIWLFSMEELGYVETDGITWISGQGEAYSVYTDDASRDKDIIYPTRSTKINQENYVNAISANGRKMGLPAGISKRSIYFGFCI